MENIITSINLLDAVLADLDEIPVEGFENQKKFVNCGTAIETVVTTLAAFLKKAEQDAPVILSEGSLAKDLANDDGIKMRECCHGIPLLGKLVGDTVELTCENGCRTARFEISKEVKKRVVTQWNQEVEADG